MKKISLSLLLFVFFTFFTFSGMVFAQNGGPAPAPSSPGVQSQETPFPYFLKKPKFLPGPPPVEHTTGIQAGFRNYITNFAGKYFPRFLGFIAVAAVFVLIVGGIMFLTAFGNEEKLTQAKKIVQWAVIGLVLSMLSYAIVKVILELPFGGTPSQSGQQSPSPPNP